jgi:hypothetical protein
VEQVQAGAVSERIIPIGRREILDEPPDILHQASRTA